MNLHHRDPFRQAAVYRFFSVATNAPVRAGGA